MGCEFGEYTLVWRTFLACITFLPFSCGASCFRTAAWGRNHRIKGFGLAGRFCFFLTVSMIREIENPVLPWQDQIGLGLGLGFGVCLGLHIIPLGLDRSGPIAVHSRSG